MASAADSRQHPLLGPSATAAKLDVVNLQVQRPLTILTAVVVARQHPLDQVQRCLTEWIGNRSCSRHDLGLRGQPLGLVGRYFYITLIGMHPCPIGILVHDQLKQ